MRELDPVLAGERVAAVIAVVLAILHVLAAPVLCQDYIVMGTPKVNIRTGPSTDHVIIGSTGKGDIFEVVGRVGNWHKVAVFSGEPRFVIAADYVYVLTPEQLVAGHGMALPASEKRCRSLFRSVQMARKRAQREAEEIVPASVDAPCHAVLRKIVEDRVILEVFDLYGVQPALYADLVKRASEHGW